MLEIVCSAGLRSSRNPTQAKTADLRYFVLCNLDVDLGFSEVKQKYDTSLAPGVFLSHVVLHGSFPYLKAIPDGNSSLKTTHNHLCGYPDQAYRRTLWNHNDRSSFRDDPSKHHGYTAEKAVSLKCIIC